MNRKINLISIICILFLIIFLLINIIHKIMNNKIENNIQTNKNSVLYNGWLKTDGYKLKNEKGETIQLRGVSSHGINWFANLITSENMNELKNNWNTNVFRVTMYTESGGEGYISQKEKNLEYLYKAVDTAIQQDMYVIVDWHILKDKDPLKYKEEAKIFFNQVSKKYANVPNVIYEICNEPNGGSVTWENNVKPYAEEIIPIIRANSEKALIIVGTPEWCTKIRDAANNPLQFENVVYSCHFYSGSHSNSLREEINYCIDKNIPIFVSECGVTKASGNGEIYKDEFEKWVEFLNKKNISWVYWSFSNKNEESAIILPTYKVNGENNTENISENNTKDNTVEGEKNCTNFGDYLTESGKFIKSVFKSYGNK